MNADTGKLLNYRHLMRSAKYKQAWSLSSANKFRCLANGIGGRIKNPTNTIEVIYQHEVPKERNMDVAYGQFVAQYAQKRLNLIKHDSLSSEKIESTIRAKLPPSPRKC